MTDYKLSIWISKQARVFSIVEDMFQRIWYKLSFWRTGECVIWNIRFVQIKGVEQICTSVEYGDIEGFIIGSDIAGEVNLSLENKKIFLEEMLDLEKSKSRFCLLVDKEIEVDFDKSLWKQFDFIITKYPNLAKKYVWNDIVIKKSESDSELLAKRFWAISFEIVESGETAKQNWLDILWETRSVDENTYLWKVLSDLPDNSIRIFWRKDLSSEKREFLEDFVINMKSVLDAEKYDLISFNIRRDLMDVILEIFPWRYPNVLETNDEDYVTLRILIRKYDVSTITRIRKIWGTDILVEPLRQVY